MIKFVCLCYKDKEHFFFYFMILLETHFYISEFRIHFIEPKKIPQKEQKKNGLNLNNEYIT